MYYVYILTNKTNNVLYIGMTNDIHRRITEHKSEMIDGFSKRYHTHKLVYFEEYGDSMEAISREKQLKGYKHEDIVIKTWITLYNDNKSLETKNVRPLVENMDITEEHIQKNE